MYNTAELIIITEVKQSYTRIIFGWEAAGKSFNYCHLFVVRFHYVLVMLNV